MQLHSIQYFTEKKKKKKGTGRSLWLMTYIGPDMVWI